MPRAPNGFQNWRAPRPIFQRCSEINRAKGFPFARLAVGQVVATNPAHSVRGPKHVVKIGKTTVLTSELRHAKPAGAAASAYHVEP